MLSKVPDPQDPGLFGHPDPDFERRLILSQKWNTAIFYSKIIFEQKSSINHDRNKNYNKNLKFFDIRSDSSSGSGSGIFKTGSGAKLSGSATLAWY